MTSAQAASAHSVPVARAAVAAVSATCNGSGVVVIPTSEGPWRSACEGCRNCNTRPVLVLTTEQAAARLRAVFAATPDDEAF